MKTIAIALGVAVTGVVLSACSTLSTKTYCLEEREANGLDYMVVTDMKVCDNSSVDAEYYDTNETFSLGDVAYIEADGDHSVKRSRGHGNIKPVPSAPPFAPYAPKPLVPAPTKICLKAYKPAPPAPKPPPAPAPKPPVVAPKPQPAPIIPKAPVNPTQAPAPTVKPGC